MRQENFNRPQTFLTDNVNIKSKAEKVDYKDSIELYFEEYHVYELFEDLLK